MKTFFKMALFLLSTSMFFQSCTSEETISEKQKISTELKNKIINTATTLNDYNFFINNAAKSNCEFIEFTYAYFNNPEGYYYSFTLANTESIDMWLTQYNDAKSQAFNTTGLKFSDEDFFIADINNLSGFSGISSRESMLLYFENCQVIWETNIEYTLPFSDISSICNSENAYPNIYLYNDDGTRIYSFNSLSSVEDLLVTYNLQNNTHYGLENVKISSLLYFNDNSEVRLNKTKDLINYFENCMFSRNTSTNDCLNFIYPLEVNRFSLQLEEVITTIIQSDKDLINKFIELYV